MATRDAPEGATESSSGRGKRWPDLGHALADAESSHTPTLDRVMDSRTYT
jgi:hypothetical protein